MIAGVTMHFCQDELMIIWVLLSALPFIGGHIKRAMARLGER